jgi:hypothetical protein
LIFSNKNLKKLEKNKFIRKKISQRKQIYPRMFSKECLKSLKYHKLPKYSLANNLYIGPMPVALEGILTRCNLNTFK